MAWLSLLVAIALIWWLMKLGREGDPDGNR